MMCGTKFNTKILNLFFPPSRKHIDFPLVPPPPQTVSQIVIMKFQILLPDINHRIEYNNKIISFSKTQKYFLFILTYWRQDSVFRPSSGYP